jgi:YidC/Oxa1 family membrane protein insertase
MNKQERVIAILLGVALVGWMFYSSKQAAKPAPAAPAAMAAASTNAPAPATLTAAPSPAAQPAAPMPALAAPSAPEEVVTLDGGDMTLAVSSHGAVLKRVTLTRYASHPGKVGADNPPVTLDFASAPALELAGVPGLAANAAYRVEKDGAGKAVTLTTATEQGLTLTRRIEVLADYQVKVTDTLRNAGGEVVTLGTNSVCLGAMQRGTSKNDMLSIDSLPAGDKAKVLYWDSQKATKEYLVGANNGGFGCGGKRSAAGLPDQATVPVAEPQAWVAIKSRFFVTGFSASESNCGFTATMARDVSKPGGSFHAPIRRYAIGLGCEVSHAAQLVYADDLDPSNPRAYEPIGISCRICERKDCHQRSVPPLERRLRVDPGRRGLLPYEIA